MREVYRSFGPGSWTGVEAHDAHDTAEADERLTFADLGKLARRARRRVVSAARFDDQPTFQKLLCEHLGDDAEALDVIGEAWPSYDHVNVQTGLDAWLAAEGRGHRLVGMANVRHQEFGIADLLRQSGPRDYGPRPGNVAWVNLPCGPDGEVRQCVRAGVYLVETDGARAAMLLRGPDPESDIPLSLQVIADRAGVAARIAAEIRDLALEHNVYRGQVISFGRDMFGERGALLRFHKRPSLTEADLILPRKTLATIRRQVVGVAEHRERLLASRQHLKRGLLLYGPPGVGKTHTVRYLLGQLTDTTIVQLTGDALGLIGAACSVARALQPAMIVVEDVDLIAEDRGMHPGQHPLLFQLLNQMDGLEEDADVVFLLTTNRADLLEPALAARPGRVDQAVELELPDAKGRRRLFALYRGDLEVDESRLDALVARTEGVTASFLKELLRRAAVLAAANGAGEASAMDGAAAPLRAVGADDDAALRVSAQQLDAALEELLDTRNAMTRVLLGGRRD